MVVKNIEELVPADASEGLDGHALFRYFVRLREAEVEEGIAMSSGCDFCMDGGPPCVDSCVSGPVKGYERSNYGRKDKTAYSK